LYALAVPVRNVNKSGVRTILATVGHVTIRPYYAADSRDEEQEAKLSLG